MDTGSRAKGERCGDDTRRDRRIGGACPSARTGMRVWAYGYPLSIGSSMISITRYVEVYALLFE